MATVTTSSGAETDRLATAHRSTTTASWTAYRALLLRDLTVLRKTLNEANTQAFANLARLVAASIDTYDSKQLELSIEVFLRGIEAFLLRPNETERISP